jgi:hypothetical protein
LTSLAKKFILKVFVWIMIGLWTTGGGGEPLLRLNRKAELDITVSSILASCSVGSTESSTSSRGRDPSAAVTVRRKAFSSEYSGVFRPQWFCSKVAGVFLSISIRNSSACEAVACFTKDAKLVRPFSIHGKDFEICLGSVKVSLLERVNFTKAAAPSVGLGKALMNRSYVAGIEQSYPTHLGLKEVVKAGTYKHTSSFI